MEDNASLVTDGKKELHILIIFECKRQTKAKGMAPIESHPLLQSLLNRQIIQFGF